MTNTSSLPGPKFDLKAVGVLIAFCGCGLALGIFGWELARGGSLRTLAQAPLQPSQKAQIEAAIEPDYPQVVAIANAIRLLAPDRMAQLAIVQAHVRTLVDYETDSRLHGTPRHVTSLDEMDRLKAANGWEYWRGDCKATAILLGSVLRALGYAVKVRTSFLPPHAWIATSYNGREYWFNAMGGKNAPPHPMAVGLKPGCYMNLMPAMQAVGMFDRRKRSRFAADNIATDTLIHPAYLWVLGFTGVLVAVVPAMAWDRRRRGAPRPSGGGSH